MSVVAALLGSRPGLAALRRSLPRGGPSAVGCRSWPALERTLQGRLVEAVVVSPRTLPPAARDRLREGWPAVPVIALAAFRPDDAPVLLAWEGEVLVEGVDDPVVGEVVMRHSLTARRRQALHDATRVLKLEDELQRRAWDLMLGAVERPWRSEALAEALGVSREHLSRQFGAGGAPNVKRVVDLCRIATATQLLANPACTVADVARLLHFASPSHLSTTARGVAGVTAPQLATLAPEDVLRRFVRGRRGRSRV